MGLMLTDLLVYSTSILAVSSSILSIKRKERIIALISWSLSTLSLLSMSNETYSIYGSIWSWSAKECSLFLVWISLLLYIFVEDAYKRFFIMLSGFSSILALQLFFKAGYLFPISLVFLFMAVYYVMKEGSELKPIGLKGTSEIIILVGGTATYLLVLYSLFGYSILMFIGGEREMIKPPSLGVDLALSALLLGISSRMWRYNWKSFMIASIISLILSFSLLSLKIPFFIGLSLLLAVSSITSLERGSIIALFLSLSLLTSAFVIPGEYSSIILKKGDVANVQGHSLRITGHNEVLSGSMDPHVADKNVISASRNAIFLAREMLNEMYYVKNRSSGNLDELFSYVGAMRNINMPFSAKGNANITLLNSSTGETLVNSSGEVELNGSLSVDLMQLYNTYYYFPYASEAFCRMKVDKFTGNATALINSDLRISVLGGNMTVRRIFIWNVRSENGTIELKNGTVLFLQADLSTKNGSISFPIPYMPISVVEETGMGIENILSELDNETSRMLMDYNTVINSTYSSSCIPSCDYFLLLPDEIPEKLNVNFDLEVDGARKSISIVYDMRDFLVNGSLRGSSALLHLPLGDLQISIDGRSSVLGRNLSSFLLFYISGLNITDRPRSLAVKSLLITRALYSAQDVQTSVGDAALALIGKVQEETYIVRARYVPLINLLWALGMITSISPWIELLIQRKVRKP